MTTHFFSRRPRLTRREILRQGLSGLGVSAGMPLVFGRAVQAMTKDEKPGGLANPERILVVV